MLTLASVGGRGEAAPAPVEAPASCTVREHNYDSIEFECTPTDTPAGGRFRFLADFSGGHDDTLITLAASIDGALAECDAGSTLRLQGVDGDLRLECGMAIPRRTGSPARLGFRVTWSHAEYVRALAMRIEST